MVEFFLLFLPSIFGCILFLASHYYPRKKVFTPSRAKTYLNFTSDKEIWRNLEHWAKKNAWSLDSNFVTEKIYKKGLCFLLIQQNGSKVHIEAWIEMRYCKHYFYKQEVAIDEAILLGRFFYPKIVIQVNELLTILESPVKIRESCRKIS